MIGNGWKQQLLILSSKVNRLASSASIKYQHSLWERELTGYTEVSQQAGAAVSTDSP